MTVQSISANSSEDKEQNSDSERMFSRRLKVDLTNYLCTKEFFVVSLVQRPEQTWGMVLCRKCACSLGEDIHVLQDATLITKHSMFSRFYVFQHLRHRKCFLCGGDILAIQNLKDCFECFSGAYNRRKQRPRGSLSDDPGQGVRHEETCAPVPEGGIAHLHI